MPNLTKKRLLGYSIAIASVLVITCFVVCNAACRQDGYKEFTRADSSLCSIMHHIHENRLDHFRSVNEADLRKRNLHPRPHKKSNRDSLPFIGYEITLKMKDENEFESLIELVKKCFPSHQFDVMYMSKADFFNKAVYTEVPGRPFLGNGYGDINITISTQYIQGQYPFQATVAFTIEDTSARSYFIKGPPVQKGQFHEDLERVIAASEKNFKRFERIPQKMHDVSKTLGIAGAINATLFFNEEKQPGHYNAVLYKTRTEEQALHAFDSLSTLCMQHFGPEYEYRNHPAGMYSKKAIIINKVGCSFYNDIPELFLMLSKEKRKEGYEITLSISHQ